ncbi:LOW QUALITY PROTEIN: hypothetical protein QTO34_010551 [Cnephaeus nilssonii]|uniref:Zinc finger protein ZFPM1 n=1 Tax=Cnephaeus nilssonii TaxID=3371016 RepID=A0AA40LFK9_CNENI|nr:LOW QUALITY PROTEIN: hypothetical protein QTO34_010551 [Eptesicus nilssonii]
MHLPAQIQLKARLIVLSLQPIVSRKGLATGAGPAPEAGTSQHPYELEQVLQDGQRCVRARRSLAEGLSWGPFHGSVQSRASSPRQAEPSPALTLLLEDEACWLRTLPRALTEAEANVEIHRKDGALWCRLTKPVPAGGLLSVLLAAEPHSTPNHPVKKEPAEPECLAPSHTDIQLLPQQAGMASILATAVINMSGTCKLTSCTTVPAARVPAPLPQPPLTRSPRSHTPTSVAAKSCPSASSLEIHMRSHSGERPFVCLICLSAFTTKANCERHLKVHTDTQSGVCHSCGFISTTRDILYSHLVTNHMVCQPGSKAEIYSPGVGHPSAKLPPGLAQAGPALALKCGLWGLPADSLPGFQQLTALHGSLASSDLGLGSTSSPGPDRKALGEATNGEARTAPQNGGSSEPPAAPRSIKAAEEPEVEPGPPAPSSRTPSPPSSAPARVKAELPSPTPGSSPGPGALFLPQFPAAPPASEILAKMSELVHSRLQVGVGAGAPAGLLAGAPKGATCFECDITFNNVSNFYVHKRLYCSGRRAPDDGPPARRPKAPPTPVRAPPPRRPLNPTSQVRRQAPGRARTRRGARPRPRQRPAAAGAVRAAQARAAGRTRTTTPDGRCARPATFASAAMRPTWCTSVTTAPRATTRRRDGPLPPHPQEPPESPPRRCLPCARADAGSSTSCRRPAPPQQSPGPAQPAQAPAPEPSASPSPRPGSGNGPDLSEGPIDLSKKPRRQASAAPVPGPAPVLPALADYHECTACRVSFHSLEAYLAHKKFSCPAAPRRPRAPEDPAVVCPYCPPNGLVHGDLVEHLRLAHGLLLGKPLTGPGPGAEARTPSPAAPRDGLNGQEPPTGPPDGSPRPGPPSAPPTPPSHSDKGVQTPSKGTPTSLPNGNHRYCRLCNIKFSSLSTFIAHKKYYCSSHAAEHVK